MLVLIVECLFAKASTANAKLESLKLRPLLQEQQLTRIYHTLKVAILTSCKNLSVEYIELKLNIYALWTSETYFTSCKKGYNRSPLREFGKVPERSEAFTTSKRSASKQLSTLLKKDVGSESR